MRGKEIERYNEADGERERAIVSLLLCECVWDPNIWDTWQNLSLLISSALFFLNILHFSSAEKCPEESCKKIINILHSYFNKV